MKKLLLIFLLLISSTVVGQTAPHWLQLKGLPVFDVKQFGAQGNTDYSYQKAAGIAPVLRNIPSGSDDTAAIQSACDAAGIGGGGIVVFPPSEGWYKITGVVNVPSGVHLFGLGGKILNCATTTFHLSGGNWEPIDGQSVRGFDLCGGNLVAYIIYDSGASFKPVDQDPAKTEQVYYIDFLTRDTGAEAPSAFDSGKYNYIFTNNTFTNGCGAFIGGSYYVASTVESYKYGTVKVTANNFGDYKDHCVYFSNARNVLVSGNTVTSLEAESSRDTFKFSTGTRNIIISNNIVVAPYANVVGVFGTDSSLASTGQTSQLIISGNTVDCARFLQFETSGVTYGVDSITISNNVVTSSGSYLGIIGSFADAAKVSKLSLSDNIFDMAGRLLISSGNIATPTVNPSGFANKVVDAVSINNNIFTTSSAEVIWVKGTLPMFSLSNNKIIHTGSWSSSNSFVSLRDLIDSITPGANAVSPEYARFVFSGNIISSNTFSLFAANGLNLVGSAPIEAAFFNNSVGTSSAYLAYCPNFGASAGMGALTLGYNTPGLPKTIWSAHSPRYGRWQTSFTRDFPSIAPGGIASYSATLYGISVGDTISVTASQTKLIIQGHVAPDNSYNLTLFNPTSEPVDLGDTTFTILVNN